MTKTRRLPTISLVPLLLLGACGDDLESRNAAVGLGGSEDGTELTVVRPAQTTGENETSGDGEDGQLEGAAADEGDEILVDAMPDELIDSAEGFAPEPMDNASGFDPTPRAPESFD